MSFWMYCTKLLYVLFWAFIKQNLNYINYKFNGQFYFMDSFNSEKFKLICKRFVIHGKLINLVHGKKFGKNTVSRHLPFLEILIWWVFLWDVSHFLITQKKIKTNWKVWKPTLLTWLTRTIAQITKIQISLLRFLTAVQKVHLNENSIILIKKIFYSVSNFISIAQNKIRK